MASKFPALFDTLEGSYLSIRLILYWQYLLHVVHKRQLGISGFGISVTTMEEVFIKVGENSIEEVTHTDSGLIDEPLLAESTQTYDDIITGYTFIKPLRLCL